jgi:hypothetical protein
MNQKHLLVAVAFLAALNLVSVAINLSIPAKAEIAGMTWKELSRDRDFRQAVQDVVAGCHTNGQRLWC